ncbi:MAG TPA: CoA transferase [Chloroflexota bacterium]|nr:CoA transferase [Chloroflexota bacterium]
MTEETKGSQSSIGARPLDGVRVLDLATVIAGPHCATLLGEFGADVIKVELPGIGDSLRKFWPQYHGTALIWRIEGRNKRCITLDMRKPKGQEIVKRLVKLADVVVENFRPGTLERWNLGYEDLKKINPGLVMVRVTGYGQFGPYKNKPGFGRVASAYGGLSYLAGYPDRPPVIPATASIPDYLTGVYGALGAMMALRHRDHTGEGQYVDIALYEPVLRILEEVPAAYKKMDMVRERLGTGSANAVPHNHYATSDGRYVAIACTNNTMFSRLCTAMGRPELAEDPRFDSNAHRVANREETDALVQEWVGSHTAKEVVEILESNEVPITLLYSVADMFEDPQYAARENLITREDPTDGEIVMSSVVPRLSLTPGRVDATGPELGAHNHEVYCDLLGFSEEELAQMKSDGVI